MGLCFSRNGGRRSRRRNDHDHGGDGDGDGDQSPSPPSFATIDPSPTPVTSSSSPSNTPPFHNQTTSSSSSSSSTTPTMTNTTTSADFSFSPSLNLPSSPPPPLPRPLPSSIFVFAANAPYPSPLDPPYPTHPNPTPSNSRNFARPIIDHGNTRNGLAPVRPLVQSPPPLVSAKKIKNGVNVHKETIKLNADANDLDSFLVSFTFDALVDGSITIFYLAKEGMDCTFTPLYPEYYMPLRIPFQRGLDQKFFQPSGTGIDVGFVDMVFFEMGELAKSSSEEDIFPLVISVETCSPPLSTNLDSIQPLPTTSPHSQITQAIIEKNKEGQLQVRVIKQILWIDGVRYELHDLYGIGNSVESGFNKVEPGKECSICMTLPKDIAVLPCRHMCMCSDCAQALRVQSNKCPICRQLIKELIQIKIDYA